MRQRHKALQELFLLKSHVCDVTQVRAAHLFKKNDIIKMFYKVFCCILKQ